MARASKRKIPESILADVFSDLPDGAFFAAMGEFGYDAADLAHEHTHHCRVGRCGRGFASSKARNQHERDKHHGYYPHAEEPDAPQA